MGRRLVGDCPGYADPFLYQDFPAESSQFSLTRPTNASIVTCGPCLPLIERPPPLRCCRILSHNIVFPQPARLIQSHNSETSGDNAVGDSGRVLVGCVEQRDSLHCRVQVVQAGRGAGRPARGRKEGDLWRVSWQRWRPLLSLVCCSRWTLVGLSPRAASPITGIWIGSS